jgi:uncharacterized protein (TIGR00255 family)
MTGFGSASKTRGGVSAAVEARSVNNRFLKVSLRCPQFLSAREHEIEGMVRERAERGTVALTVRVVRDSHPVRVRLNESAAADYGRLLKKLAKASGAEGEPELSTLARLPGVFDAEEVDSGLSDEAFATVAETVGRALDRMTRMRDREGANLKRDFAKRAGEIRRLVKALAKRAPQVPVEFGRRLQERINAFAAGEGVSFEETDLIREVAVFAERCDVTEEVTRLDSHLQQFDAAIKGDGSLGRRLDFLIQEMMREANTISAKASDVEMSRVCVDLKVEMDRLKEQVQNVE